MVDYFTKWFEAFSLKTESVEEDIGCIVKQFNKFGVKRVVNWPRHRICEQM